MAGDRRKKSSIKSNWRITVLRSFFVLFSVVIILRLFSLQVMQADFYQAISSGQHEIYEELIAERGNIYVSDWKDGSEYLAATNERRAFIYAEPRKIEDPEYTATTIAKILGYDLDSSDITEITDVAISDDTVIEESDFEILLERLSKADDPYEPIAHDIAETVLDKIMALNIEGIHYVLEASRSYPETNLGGHIFGFVSQSSEDGEVGQYGIEGYYDDFLSGKNGFLDAVTDVAGSWIGVGKRDFDPAKDGGDILLTIDRNIQYHVCKILAEGVETYDAESGSVIVLEPSTGKIIAMCNVPDFDPNEYNQVEDISVYNNLSIFDPYEPGSVIKPLVMAAALDVGAVVPSTTYEDTGEVEVEGYLKPIKNSDLKSHGIQTMTEVLEKSLNTGMVFVMREMGGKIMARYYDDYGFGTLTGIDLNTETNGTMEALDYDHEAFYAPASYGQGFTITLMQLASAYGVLANNGMLMQPYIVSEKRYTDGTVETIRQNQIRQVIDPATAQTISAMLVSVVENGHANKGAVDGYYIAGKTGTAQVADAGGYGDLTNATFAGYGPIEDPAFVIAVRLEHPRAVEWAADTAAPIFGDIAEYVLDYFEVAPNR